MRHKNPFDIATEFADQIRKTFNEELQSALLVGSAVRGDFITGKSDINTILILSPEGIEWLEKVYPILQSWLKKGISVPHFMTAESVRNALDSYPLEFLDFKSFHRVILGPDILADLEIPHEPLRLQIERELRGKLFLLRQVFASQAGHNRQLLSVAKQSVSVFTAVFQGILELNHRPITALRADIFSEVAGIVGFSDQVFQRLLEIREGQSHKNLRVIFKDLLIEIGKAVRWIDRYEVQEKSK